MDNYQRDTATLSSTLPFYQFKRDFTTVNSYYWGVASALQAVSGRVRHMEADEDFHKELGLTQQTYAKPLGHNPQRYAEKLNVSKRWHRLLTLVTMAGAFERYMTGVATLAIASDPVLTPGFPKKVDGLTLAKYQLHAGERSTENLTKGEWSARIAEFRRHFGAVPISLQSNEGDLERMRKLRNRIVHDSGIDASSMSPLNAILLGARRFDTSSPENVSISETTLKKWLGMLDVVATEIDSYLLTNFIGGYELAAIYIEWDKDRDGLYRTTGIKRYGKGSEARKFSKFLGALLSYPIRLEIAQAIMDYVETL